MDLRKLKEIRKARGKTVKEVSRETGINRNRLSLIERGKVNPSFEAVEKIASAIGAQIVVVM